ncbi:integrase, partial [Enterobacter hormaechei]|nr:integrase [Enterobacter hormaechei]
KPNTKTLYKSIVYNTMYTQFSNTPVADVPISSWVKFFDKQEKTNPKKARVLLMQLRSVINWCISRQFISSCEVLKLSPKTIGKRPDVG